jgi:hypothetical protein
MKAVPALVLVTGLLAGAVRAEADTPRLRTDDPLAAMLVTRGLDGSDTFVQLYQRLERSNVIVHVRRATAVPEGSAHTQFIATAGSYRFVRITLNVDDVADEDVALLGHELRHAVELADDPDVNDDGDYQRFYDRIGYQSCQRAAPRCYETHSAVQAGRDVLRELKQRPIAVGGAIGAATALGRWLSQAGGGRLRTATDVPRATD